MEFFFKGYGGVQDYVILQIFLFYSCVCDMPNEKIFRPFQGKLVT
jgi:hypothetical protein